MDLVNLSIERFLDSYNSQYESWLMRCCDSLGLYEPKNAMIEYHNLTHRFIYDGMLIGIFKVTTTSTGMVMKFTP